MYKDSAENMRKNLLELAYNTGNVGAHIGGSLSIIEILMVLHCDIMKFDKDNSDDFILSKGHGGLGYYTALYECGKITKEQLFSFEENGGILPGQPSKNTDIGIVYSSGSLGMGLSFGIGRALSYKMDNKNNKVYVLMGDGECNEGSVWESVFYACANKLDNLVIIVDANGLQSDGNTQNILNMNLLEMFKANDLCVIEVDGHDCEQLISAFSSIHTEKPLLIYAHTIKGKGVSFMENNNEWHHSRITKEQYLDACSQINGVEI
ncbi:MAG: transketolase [Clostridia bacterium]